MLIMGDPTFNTDQNIGNVIVTCKITKHPGGKTIEFNEEKLRGQTSPRQMVILVTILLSRKLKAKELN